MFELHLIVADPALRAAVAEQLTLAAFENVQLRDSANLATSFSDELVALIIDAPLVDGKTLKILRGMHEKEKGSKRKVFILGTVGLDDAFAAECFPKPLRLGHLLARVQFHLQAMRMQGEPLVFGPFRLEPAMRQIVVKETAAVIRLTEKETHLLEYLGRNKTPVAREELLAAIWGYDARIDTHTLETHIYRLRRKLDPEARGSNTIIVEQGAYYLAAVQP